MPKDLLDQLLMSEISERSNHQLRLIAMLTDNIPDAIIGTDLNYTINSWNKGAEKLYGFSKGEVMGKRTNEVIKTQFVTEHDIRQWKAQLEEKGFWQGEVVQTRKDGSPVYIMASISKVIDDQGEVIGVVAVNRDISALKRTDELIIANENLEKSREHFKLLFDISPVAKTLSTAEEGIIIDVNPAWEKLFERKKEHVIGKSAAQLALNDPVKREELVKQVRAHGGALDDIEMTFRRHNAPLVKCYMSLRSLMLDGVEHMLISYVDITSLKTAEEQIVQQNAELEAINKELSSFVYIASHDLQEPLRTIRSFIDLVLTRESANVSEKGRTYLQHVSQGASRMRSLIDDLLQYSRTTSSEKNFTMTDIDEVLEEVRQSLTRQIHTTSAIIYNEKLPTIKVIHFQFRQLLSNILSNSLKFRRDSHPPIINIAYERCDVEHHNVPESLPADTYHHFIITDNGIGFDPAFNERIFQVFQRLHTREKYEGTGIGLAICKKIVDHHKGLITAAGEPDKGARFDIYIRDFGVE